MRPPEPRFLVTGSACGSAYVKKDRRPCPTTSLESGYSGPSSAAIQSRLKALIADWQLRRVISAAPNG
jgi:hypothetical protein